MPKVSVILTSYNHGKYICDAIDSILNQTFSDFELIIWDDASQDNSWEIICSYQDSRIRAFQNDETRRGIYGINRAISEVAQGEYIAIHHSDDMWEQDKLEKQVIFLDTHDQIGAVFTNVLPIGEDGEPFDREDHFYFRIFEQPNRTRFEWLRYFFLAGNALCHPSVLIRRSCYEDCGLYRFGLAQLVDFDMWSRLCLKHDIYVLPERLVKFRVRDNEANSSANRPETRIRHVYEFYKLLQNYRNVKQYNEFVQIFPEAVKYCSNEKFDVDYALAMVCFELKPSPYALLFAQDILFERIFDPERAIELSRHFNFDYRSFIALSAQHDVFALEELAHSRLLLAKQDAELAERDGQISGLHQTVNEREAQLAEQDGQIVGLLRAVTERDGQLHKLLHDIEAITRSTSWQITAPYRWMGHQAKRVLHVWRVLPTVLQRGGGAWAVATKACAVFRHEGVSGIKRCWIKIQSQPELPPVVMEEGGTVDRNDYQEWIRRYDTLDEEGRQQILGCIASLVHRPLISIIIPGYDPPLQFFDEAIRSVRNQLYQDWELCIADDASTNEAVRDILRRNASEDPRIRVVYREKNGHISAASNSALEIARGEFIALLDHDDLLPEHALFHVVQAVNEHPVAAIIYSDEDKIDEAGQRYDPYFKCEFNYELMLSQNMICHLGVYRRDLVTQIGGFRLGLEGAQDYDLALRVIERIDPSLIVHIPRVLYHWRAIQGSTARSSNEKIYAAEAGRKAVAEHLERVGRKAMIMPAPEAPPMNRVRFVLPEELPLVSILIPTRDRAELLGMCLDSVFTKTSYPNYEVVIIDNGSVEAETMALFERLPKGRVQVIRDDSPFNYSRLNNLGAKLTKGAVLCLMNNDIEILVPDWIEEMMSFALQPDVGCVGARLWYPDGTLQHGGVIVGLGGVAGHSHRHFPKGHPGYFGRAVLAQSLSAVTAACLMIRREVFEEVGGLDEEFAVAFNDIDFCLRVRDKGYRNVWTPFAEMIHYESASRGYETTPERQKRFLAEIDFMKERWGEKLTVDPAYNPNLTLDHEDFSLAWPPRTWTRFASNARNSTTGCGCWKRGGGFNETGFGWKF